MLAYEKDLDLVEVGSNANPPVCRLFDYGKYIYEKEKQAQKQRGKQRGGETKEIQLGVNIDKHDLETKVKKANKFLNENNNVRISIRLKGRQNIFANRAREVIEEFRNLTQSRFDQHIKRQGSRFSAILKR